MTEIDPDVPEAPVADALAAGSPARRALIDHRAIALLCVFVGGVLGTAARAALGLAYPAGDGLPYATWATNVAGALVLGLLTGVLTGGNSGFHRGLRLAAGTGFCGGFTTYSTLADQTADLLGGAVGGGLLYASGTLLIGAATAWLGLTLGVAAAKNWARRRHTRTESAATASTGATR